MSDISRIMAEKEHENTDERITVRFVGLRRKIERSARKLKTDVSGFLRASAEMATEQTLSGNASIVNSKLEIK